MGSMHTGLEEPGLPIVGTLFGGGLNKMAVYFAERAKGHVGLMVTGGIAPNHAGRVAPFAADLVSSKQAKLHKEVTSAVHNVGSGSKICMQILHAGRYAYHPQLVSATAVHSRPHHPCLAIIPALLHGSFCVTNFLRGNARA
jgi:2,4-dienoyl-CoA reductase (NADPH2)